MTQLMRFKSKGSAPALLPVLVCLTGFTSVTLTHISNAVCGTETKSLILVTPEAQAQKQSSPEIEMLSTTLN
jgi:hypothetical protein